MSLYLVQHGKSLPKTVDPDQGLSDEGKAEVEQIAQTAKIYAIKIDEIKHSMKKRARETAEIFSDTLNVGTNISEMTGLKPLDDVAPIAEAINMEKNIMLVGHLPFMERLTALVVAGNLENTVFKFQNGGMVCLDRFPDPVGWAIKWALMPTIES